MNLLANSQEHPGHTMVTQRKIRTPKLQDQNFSFPNIFLGNYIFNNETVQQLDLHYTLFEIFLTSSYTHELYQAHSQEQMNAKSHNSGALKPSSIQGTVGNLHFSVPTYGALPPKIQRLARFIPALYN